MVFLILDRMFSSIPPPRIAPETLTTVVRGPFEALVFLGLRCFGMIDGSIIKYFFYVEALMMGKSEREKRRLN